MLRTQTEIREHAAADHKNAMIHKAFKAKVGIKL